MSTIEFRENNQMNHLRKLLIIFISIIFVSCMRKETGKPIFIASDFPVKMILQEITGNPADVGVLLPPGASPHTFAPNPSDIVNSESAKALFYVSDNLDGWAARLHSKTNIELIKLLPKEFILTFDEPKGFGLGMTGNNANVTDPHFWTDPLAVKALVPNLTETLCRLDSTNAQKYRNNAKIFEERLDMLDRQVRTMTANIKGKYLFLFHPSFRYFARRYGLIYGGSVEIDPGIEPPARYAENLMEKIKKSGTKALFTEPQFPKIPAKVIAQSLVLKLYQLDPIGGTAGREYYLDLIVHNALVLKEALE